MVRELVAHRGLYGSIYIVCFCWVLLTALVVYARCLFYQPFDSISHALGVDA